MLRYRNNVFPLQGLPTWRLKSKLDFPKFSFRENKKSIFFAASYPQQDYNTWSFMLMFTLERYHLAILITIGVWQSDMQQAKSLHGTWREIQIITRWEPDIVFIHEFLIPFREGASLWASDQYGIKNEWMKMIWLLTCDNLFITYYRLKKTSSHQVEVHLEVAISFRKLQSNYSRQIWRQASAKI